ncbi:MAG: antitoxin component YwqK of YwqJK toxin-antitoxin module [Flavobacteriales bacterium]|jgi:antitoxin component YwqK of YwqJK toxin-antitoxin module
MSYSNSFLILVFILVSSVSVSAQKREFKQYFFNNGKVASEGYLVDGKPDGFWKSFYQDGKPKSQGDRLNFALEGLWKFYDTQGSLKEEIGFKEGKKHGIFRKYEQGLLLSEFFYLEERLDSVSRWFYPTGQVKRSVPFDDNFEQGKGFEYAIDGTILAMQKYRSGVMVKNLKINRVDSEGRKQGLFMEFYTKKNTKSEGMYFNDLKDGYFKYYLEDGGLQKNERWIMGVLQTNDANAGRIRLSATYNEAGYVERMGGYRNGKMDGGHRLFNEKGDVILNQIYQLGVLIAEGTVDSLGLRQGEWKSYYEKGALKSKGNYQADKKMDKWYFFFIDSTLEQVGSYKNDFPDGSWKWYFQGQILQKEERYRNGLLSGNSVEYDSFGNVLAKGSYIEGQKDGRWIYELNDHKEVGRYKDGLMTGEWNYFYEGGYLQFNGSYIDGIKHNNHTWYYPNSKIRVSGSYFYGRKTGAWKYYEISGLLIVTVFYENGVETKYNGSKIGVELVE